MQCTGSLDDLSKNLKKGEVWAFFEVKPYLLNEE